MIRETWQGFEISKRIKDGKFRLYVKSIYKGEIKWTRDYTHAKHYSEKTAKRIDAEIDEAIRNGEFTDILADSEVKDEPEVIEEVKDEPETAKPSINITTDASLIDPDGWDFPIEELDYLLEEHNGETFVLIDGRLYEAI